MKLQSAYPIATGRPIRRICQVGISTSAVCGVRDSAVVLGDALASHGIEAPLLWCRISGTELRADTAAVGVWLDRLRHELATTKPDAVLLHYSAFAFGWHGLPVFAPVVARELRRAEVAVLALFHELAYPFGRRGLAGTAQAVSQRAVLPSVLASCDAAVVTTESRRRWLGDSRWLPRRPVAFLPVPSNLPPAFGAGDNGSRLVVAVVGYAWPSTSVGLVAEAVSLLRRHRNDVVLLLLGAPGDGGAAAAMWRRELDRRGCSGILAFTGVLSRERLADALARGDLIVFPDRAGPESRRGTLAAALAAGKTVLAIDGPETWPELAAEEAVVLVPPDAKAVGKELIRYADDARLRMEQGARASAFYAKWSSPEIAAASLLQLLGEVGARGRGSASGDRRRSIRLKPRGRPR